MTSPRMKSECRRGKTLLQKRVSPSLGKEKGCDDYGSHPSGFRNVNIAVINNASIADPDDSSHQIKAPKPNRSENSVNLEIQPILGFGSDLVSSNIDAADAASGDAGSADDNRHTSYTIAGNAGNASNGNIEAIASSTAALMNPNQDRLVIGEHPNILPVSGDGGEVFVPSKSAIGD